VFVALMALLVHALAIHETYLGAVAPPSDYAHVAFRYGRQLARSGQLSWNASDAVPGLPPSLLWAWVAAFAERFQITVTNFCQGLGALSTLLTVLVLARFSPDRVSGVIAPVLFVVCGAAATAAGSGAETALLGLLLTGSLLAYERRWPSVLALLLALAVLTRSEGGLVALTLCAFEFLGLRPRAREGASRRTIRWPFIAPLGVALVLAWQRQSDQGDWRSPWMRAIFAGDAASWRANLDAVRDAFVGLGGPLLFVFPLWYTVRGLLHGIGVRSCLITLVWILALVAGGERPEPFGQALAPVLAILYVAVQQAMAQALDSPKRYLPRLTWALFVAGGFVSLAASKFPGQFEPPWMERMHRRWMTPESAARFGYRPSMGRSGLQEEIDGTEILRAIGLFLRDNAPRDSTVLTPWPGAIGYLSRLRVEDLLGRTSVLDPARPQKAWNGTKRTDVIAVVSRQPDHIVPLLRMPISAPSVQEIASSWIDHLDFSRGDPQRRQLLYDILSSEYELITVPVSTYTAPGTLFNDRFYLMRSRALRAAPRLELSRSGLQLRVLVHHAAPAQIVDLRVVLRLTSGETLHLLPTGEFAPGEPRNARTSILLLATGEQPIDLARVTLPEDCSGCELVISLLNPGAKSGSAYDAAAPPCQLHL
jgi:hypothetical protein